MLKNIYLGRLLEDLDVSLIDQQRSLTGATDEVSDADFVINIIDSKELPSDQIDEFNKALFIFAPSIPVNLQQSTIQELINSGKCRSLMT